MSSSITTNTDEKEKKNMNNNITQEIEYFVFQNAKKLALLHEYEIAGEKYTKKMLTPEELENLKVLEYESTQQKIENNDIRKFEKDRQNFIKEKAKICLEGMTDEKFKKTDIGYLEQVINACILYNNGFRQI